MKEDIITIDGPTSSGKNSVGFLLAQKLGYQYIDSGMIYRAGSLRILKNKVSAKSTSNIVDIFRNLNIKFKSEGNWEMFLDNENVTDKLHTPEISNLVHVVAAIPQVREETKKIQKRITENGKVVMGGRDIGSEIFPDAKYKFWLTASIETRAKRRYKQLSEKNTSIKYQDVLADMLVRDNHDKERKASPMRIPKDAIIIDNTNLTIEESVIKMLSYIN